MGFRVMPPTVSAKAWHRPETSVWISFLHKIIFTRPPLYDTATYSHRGSVVISDVAAIEPGVMQLEEALYGIPET